MPITHNVVKVPGQRVYAVSDWNAEHIITSPFNIDHIAEATPGHDVVFDNDVDLDNNDLTTVTGTVLAGIIDSCNYSCDDNIMLFVPDADGGQTHGIRIDAVNNNVYPIVDDFMSLGENTLPVNVHRWKDLYLSGDAEIGGDVYVLGALNVAQKINHIGEEDHSYLEFTADQLDIYLSDANFATFKYVLGGQSYNWFNRGAVDIDFIISGDSEANLFYVDANLDVVRIGDYDTNYTNFSVLGYQTMVGQARIERHQVIGAASLKKGAVQPGEGFIGLYPTLDFANGRDDAAHYIIHVPYRWDATTNMHLTLNWMHDTGADAGTVLWKCTYLSSGCEDDPTGAGTEIQVLTAGNHPADEIICSVMDTEILAANLTTMDDLVLKIWRNDSAAGDTLAEDARLVSVHIHMTQNKLGQAT